MSRPVLEVIHVRKSYGDTVALDDVSLTVNEGELFGLLGPNGAGKTTLISILCGLLDADGGEVRLFGQTFHRRRRELRRWIGLASQDLALYPDLTARENLRFFARLYGLEGSELENRVAEMLQAVGLEERAEERVASFSGGMKRRLHLAAAIVHRPRLLFLDEPTTGVDPQSRNYIFELIRTLNRGGMTIVYTSHYLEEVEALCPRLAILDDGRLRACDTLPRLLALLDGQLLLTVEQANRDFLERLPLLPGVKNAVQKDGRWEILTDHVAEVLPRVVRLAAEVGVQITAIDARPPSLERVFLHLTGRELRD
jgi:ABC-2 type transport system ATP-binding protein